MKRHNIRPAIAKKPRASKSFTFTRRAFRGRTGYFLAETCATQLSVWVALGRPFAKARVARNLVWLEQRCAPVGARVVGFSTVSKRSGVLVLCAIVAGRIGRQCFFFPNPPPIVRPGAMVTVAIAKKDQVGGGLNHAPLADVFLLGPPERRLRAAEIPMHIHRADPARNGNLAKLKLAHQHGVAIG